MPTKAAGEGDAMTSEEWERCEDSNRMLAYLFQIAGEDRQRKVRLFACALCRRIWGLLTDERCRKAVETAERYADRLASRAELVAAEEEALFVAEASGSSAAAVAAAAAWSHKGRCSRNPALRSLPSSARRAEVTGREVWTEARRNWSDVCGRVVMRPQADLIRCVFGNPWHPPAPIDPAVLAHKGGAAPHLAEAIYGTRRFEDLPLLADLLEEAGCTDPALLGHLRGPGPHCLGCWALDTVLGKD